MACVVKYSEYCRCGMAEVDNKNTYTNKSKSDTEHRRNKETKEATNKHV